jgi:hypothetical protein
VVTIPGRTIHHVELAVGTVVEYWPSILVPPVEIRAVESEYDPLSVFAPFLESLSDY